MTNIPCLNIVKFQRIYKTLKTEYRTCFPTYRFSDKTPGIFDFGQKNVLICFSSIFTSFLGTWRHIFLRVVRRHQHFPGLEHSSHPTRRVLRKEERPSFPRRWNISLNLLTLLNHKFPPEAIIWTWRWWGNQLLTLRIWLRIIIGHPLVSYGCCNKGPQTSHIKTPRVILH